MQFVDRGSLDREGPLIEIQVVVAEAIIFDVYEKQDAAASSQSD